MVFGKLLDLRKGEHYNITQKRTIETTEDCISLLEDYFQEIGFDTSKLVFETIDGNAVALAKALQAKYQDGGLLIWCLSHIYNLIFKNTFKNDAYYLELRQIAIEIKRLIDGSNINRQQVEHFAAELETVFRELELFDPVRYVTINKSVENACF